MSQHDEQPIAYSGSGRASKLLSVTEKINRLVELNQERDQLEAELRQDMTALKAALPRQRKAKPKADKPKRGRPKKAAPVGDTTTVQ